MIDTRQAQVDELLGMLRHERSGDGWVGRTPDGWGPVVFGGVGLALTVAAACGDAPDGARLHSFHAHFLRPIRGGEEITFHTDVVKAGRSFSLHHVEARQQGKPVLTATCSFTADTDGGYVYDAGGIPADAGLPDATDDLREEDGPWDVRWLGPTPRRDDGTYAATHRHWFRVARPLPSDEPDLHTALLAYATDWTGVGGRPLDLDGDTTGMISLDHAAWFHRPARVDEWLLQDVECLVNAGGRGTLRGVLRDANGRIVASMAQEMLLAVSRHV